MILFLKIIPDLKLCCGRASVKRGGRFGGCRLTGMVKIIMLKARVQKRGTPL